MKCSVFGLAIAAILLLFATAFVAHAQPRGKMYRVGYIQTATHEEQMPLTKAYDESLRQIGYAEGRNVVIEAGARTCDTTIPPTTRRSHC